MNIDRQRANPKRSDTTLDNTIGNLRLNSSIPAGSTIITEIAVGFDGLIHFTEDMTECWKTGLPTCLLNAWNGPTPSLSMRGFSRYELYEMFLRFYQWHNHLTPGYAHRRRIRLETFDDEINELSENLSSRKKSSDYEMEVRLSTPGQITWTQGVDYLYRIGQQGNGRIYKRPRVVDT